MLRLEYILFYFDTQFTFTWSLGCGIENVDAITTCYQKKMSIRSRFLMLSERPQLRPTMQEA
jgi:hypothetical protein